MRLAAAPNFWERTHDAPRTTPAPHRPVLLDPCVCAETLVSFRGPSALERRRAPKGRVLANLPSEGGACHHRFDALLRGAVGRGQLLDPVARFHHGDGVSARIVQLAGGAHGRALRVPRDGAPCVLLLHGAGGNADTFRPCLEAWAWADLWCIDLPGRGGSDGPALDSIQALADWVHAFIEASDIDPIVVGHSLGGGIGLELALRHPDRIAGLAMVSSGARLRVSPKILEAVRTASEPMRLDFAFADDRSAPAYHDHANRTPLEATAADWTACDGFDARSRLPQLRMPLAVVWGSVDALTPPKFQRWLVEQTGATGRELQGFGHMLPWEAPAGVAQAVEDFAAS